MTAHAVADLACAADSRCFQKVQRLFQARHAPSDLLYGLIGHIFEMRTQMLCESLDYLQSAPLPSVHLAGQLRERH